MNIRLRLTLWYSALVALTLIVFALTSFEEMRRNLLASIDGELRFDLEQASTVLRKHGRLTQLDGDIVQIANAYESPPARALLHRKVPLRSMSTRVEGHEVRVFVRTDDYERAVRRFRNVTLVSLPLALLVAAAGGMWMSGRALRPVDRIIRDARTINARSLDRRLELPQSRDELFALSQTFNEMFDRLESAFARISDFTADASHELRTPVTMMRTSAEIALRHPRTNDEYAATLAAILAESERMSSMIDDLLALARSDAASETLVMERVDLADPIRDAIAQREATAAEKNVRINFSSGGQAPSPVRTGEAPVLHGNRVALQRMFLALIDNAVKFTPSGGEVSIVMSDNAVVVRDTGPGIAADDLPHVFERFYRGDKSRSRGGTGLGLAIAKRIAELHGGTIAVSNGSEFRVTLPIAASDASAPRR
jgi:heavy metal sensor kinase